MSAEDVAAIIAQQDEARWHDGRQRPSQALRGLLGAERANGPTEDQVINWNEANDYQADRETGT